MKVFIWLSIIFNISYGCATCQLMVPSVELNVTLQTQKKHLDNIHFVWNFSDLYTDMIMSQYDKNDNQVLDEKELYYC